MEDEEDEENKYAGEYEHVEKIENISELKREFTRKFHKMPKEEIEKFDEWFAEEVEPALNELLSDKYSGYHPVGRNAREKRQKFIDYVYMYMIAHNKNEIDDRYDQPMLYAAMKYAEQPIKKKMRA